MSVPTPKIAYLLPTGRCNLHCSGCYATLESWGRHTRRGELGLDDYRRIVAELLEMGTRIFDISGGEPLIYPHLIEICEAIRAEPEARIWLVSNGTLFAKNDKLEALSGLVERLAISLDAPEAPLHDELRGRKGAFDLSVQTLRRARELPFPEVAVNQLLCRPNADSVAEMVAFCRRERVDRLALLTYRDVSENGVMPEMIPPLESLERAWRAVAEELAKGEDPKVVDLVVPAFLFPESTAFRRGLPAALRDRLVVHHPHLRGRTAFRETLVVKPFGALSGDTAMINSDLFDLGSATGGVERVWRDEAPEWRRRLAAREERLRSEGPCSGCSRWHVCRGGCPAAAQHQWGDPDHHDRSCDQFRAAGDF